jgi:hypothetical protein
MVSHILEAGRAKVADEGSARSKYDRVKRAYDEAVVEHEKLGQPRAVGVIQADVQALRIDMRLWRRSAECSDISREDTKEACRPALALYQERGRAARKAELEPEVARLREQLATLQRPEEASVAEGIVAGVWAWLAGSAVVLLATFGTVIFARPAANTPTAITEREQPLTEEEIEELKRIYRPQPPKGGGPRVPAPSGEIYSRDEAKLDLTALTAFGSVPDQLALCHRWRRPKSTVSRGLAEWEREGIIVRTRTGKQKAVVAA